MPAACRTVLNATWAKSSDFGAFLIIPDSVNSEAGLEKPKLSGKIQNDPLPTDVRAAVALRFFSPTSNRLIQAFPRVLRAMAFAPAARPASLPLRSAKPPHSCRPRFQLVPQPENPSVSLTRPFAPATMLGLAPLALRVWAYANGRPLHSVRIPINSDTYSNPFRTVFRDFGQLSERSDALP